MENRFIVKEYVYTNPRNSVNPYWPCYRIWDTQLGEYRYALYAEQKTASHHAEVLNARHKL